MDELKAEHDKMLANIPPGVEHDTDNCPLCASDEANVSLEGGDMSTTYTEEELASKVADAVAPFKAELDSLKQSLTEQDIDARIAQAKSEVADELETAKQALDVAVADLEAVKVERDAIISWLEAEKVEQEETAAREARKDERVTAVKEVANYSDEHVAANADRWASKSDEDFAAFIEDLKAAKAAREEAGKKEDKTELPAATAMTASAEKPSGDAHANMREVMDLRFQGIDPRKIN